MWQHYRRSYKVNYKLYNKLCPLAGRLTGKKLPVLDITRDSEAFYLSAPSDNNKERNKILDASHFITQFQWKHLFFLITLMFWE